MTYSVEAIARAVQSQLPGRTMAHVAYRGLWIRHTYLITLDGGELVILKVRAENDTSGITEKEAWVAGLLLSRGLPAPRTLAVDTSCTLLDQPYILQEALGGTSLYRLLPSLNPTDAAAVYAAVGRFYREAHAISHTRSGWIEGAGRVLEFSPNRYMHQKVIVEQGESLVQAGRLEPQTYHRVLAVFARHMPYLEDHTPSLLPGSALPWCICVEQEGPWRVTRVMDLPDSLYWDPAFDLAMLKYPPFGQHHGAGWQAFLAEYGPEPPERRLLLYRLMQRLDAAGGNYMAPADPANAVWADTCLSEVPSLLDAIEGQV